MGSFPTFSGFWNRIFFPQSRTSIPILISFCRAAVSLSTLRLRSQTAAWQGKIVRICFDKSIKRAWSLIWFSWLTIPMRFGFRCWPQMLNWGLAFARVTHREPKLLHEFKDAIRFRRLIWHCRSEVNQQNLWHCEELTAQHGTWLLSDFHATNTSTLVNGLANPHINNLGCLGSISVAYSGVRTGLGDDVHSRKRSKGTPEAQFEKITDMETCRNGGYMCR